MENRGENKLPMDFLKKTTYLLFEQTINSQTPIQGNQPKINLNVNVLTFPDFMKAPPIFQKITPDAFQKFEKGDLCFGAAFNGFYVGMSWVAFRDFYVNEIESTIRVPKDTAYIYGTYCLPEFRRLGVHTSIMSGINSELSRIGVKAVYLLINNNNSAMRIAAQKNHAYENGQFTLIKILNFKHVSFKAEKNTRLLNR